MIPHITLRDLCTPARLAHIASALLACIALVVAISTTNSVELLIDTRPWLIIPFSLGLLVILSCGATSGLILSADLHDTSAGRQRRIVEDEALPRRWISGGMPE